MLRPLKRHHRIFIDRMVRRTRITALDETLTRLSNKGFDVASVPFQLVDEALSDGDDARLPGLEDIAYHTFGGQPALLRAALSDIQQGEPSQLHDLIRDEHAHPMTRFEAMGWAAFTGHRAEVLNRGQPVGKVFQFWDTKTSPPEIADATAAWADMGADHHCYTEEEANAYIAASFGADAAKDFGALWHPAVKSDVFRLYRLAQGGGLYADADSMPQPLCKRFLQAAGDRVWMSSMTNMPNCVVNNWFIAAPPQSPFIEVLLEHVLSNLAKPADRGIFWLSGPGAYTSFVYRNLGVYDVGLLPNAALKIRYFKQFDAPYKHTTQNWRVYEHARGIDNEAGLRYALMQ